MSLKSEAISCRMSSFQQTESKETIVFRGIKYKEIRDRMTNKKVYKGTPSSK